MAIVVAVHSSTIGGLAARIQAGVLDLLAPARCAGCLRVGESATDLCPSCRALLRESSPLAWSIAENGAHAHRRAGQQLPAFAATRYEGEVRSMLLAYKERGRQALQRELGGALFVACVAALACGRADPHLAPVRLVPVPSRRATVKARGHDAVRGLAEVAAAELRRVGVQARAAPALRQARAVADQAGLDVAARSANLAGALVVRRPMRDRAVIVVDDIVTTGSTAAEAARALTEAGAVVLAVAAVAATPRRRPHGHSDAAPGWRAG